MRHRRILHERRIELVAEIEKTFIISKEIIDSDSDLPFRELENIISNQVDLIEGIW